MNRQLIQSVAEKAAVELGYTPTPYQLRHQALRTHHLPLMAIHPPRLVGIEGEKRREELYEVEIILMKENGLDGAQRMAAFDAVAADIAPLLAAIKYHPRVLSLSGVEASQLQRPVTVAGEASVALKMTIRLIADCGAE